MSRFPPFLSRPFAVAAASTIATFAIGAVAALPARAQEPTPPAAGSLPPIRPLGKVTAASSELLSAVSQVRALPDGRVLVNDNTGRKVVLFDAGLTGYTVVADTTSATANAYSSRAGGLIAFKGDSTLFVDPTSLSMLVIDGKGQITRVMSVPRPSDAIQMIGGPNGTPAFDAQGRLVYRAMPAFRFGSGAGGRSGASGAAPSGFALPEMADTVALLRVDLATRQVDTIAHLKIAGQKITATQTAEGRLSITPVLNPMQYVDDWAVTSDGRVAVIRGREYRVDWLGADGNVTGTEKIPFAWRRLDDSTKRAFLDSTQIAMEKLRQQAVQMMQRGGGGVMAMAGSGAMVAVAAGTSIGVMGGAGTGTTSSPPPRGSTGSGNIQIPQIQLVDASQLPDYAPPFGAGATNGDADGNIWVRTSNVYEGGSVYDVVNRDGKLVDRVLLPPGRVIAGFGPGVVYMGVRVDESNVRLERASIRAQP